MAKNNSKQTITGMRKALATMHNEGNGKAINREFAAGAGADTTVFNEWLSMVEGKLFGVVGNYVRAKKDQRWDKTITDAKLESLRNKIYPVWKECVAAGEEWKTVTHIRVTTGQIEDLVGFAWKFVRTGSGTAEAMEGKQTFRKKVESLIGCEMAKNAMLTDAQRDAVAEFYGAQRSMQKCDDKLGELEEQKKAWLLLKKENTSADLLEVISSNIRRINSEKEEVKKTRELAEATEKKHRTTVLDIEKLTVKKIRL